MIESPSPLAGAPPRATVANRLITPAGPVPWLAMAGVAYLVVAVALSAQATDVSVNKATDKLFKVADTPQKMLALGEAGLIRHIKTIGLFRAKAKNVIGLSQQLIDRFGGKVPDTRDALESLPGVRVFHGEKQAGVVSFLLENEDVEQTAKRLSMRGVCVRAGLHCAPLAHESAGTLRSGTVRVGFSVFNTAFEVRQAVRALKL